MADYVLSATLELKDKFSAVLKRAGEGVSHFTDTLKETGSGVDKAANSFSKVGNSAVSAASKVDKMKKSLDKVKGTHTTTLEARDRASSIVQKVESKVNDLTKKKHTIALDVKQTMAPLNSLKNKASNALQGITAGLPTQMIGFAGIGYGITDTLRTYTDFTHQMSRVQAIAGATNEQLDQLTAKARERGMMTQFTAAEAGKAMEYMGMAGWKTKDMLQGINGIMDLAAASGEDLGNTADIVTDALSAFNLKAKDSGMFADVLAAAATNANTNVGMMGYTFKYAAPLAGALGYSVQDVALATGLMANSGIKADQAGTSLRSLFTRLAAPTKQSGTAMDELGLSLTNAQGKMRSFRSVLAELRKDFRGKSETEKVRLASMLAGTEGMSGFLSIMNASDQDWDKLVNAIDNSQGAAKNMADVSTKNLWGSIKSIQSAWESVQLSFMDLGAGDTIKEFVDAVTIDFRKFSESLKDGFQFTDVLDLTKNAVQQLIDKFIKLDGVGSLLAGGTLIFGLKKVYDAVRKINDGWKTLGKGPATTEGTSKPGLSDMVVNANNVVVNGKGGISGETGGNVPGPGKQEPGGKNYLGTIMNILPAALTAVKNIHDVYKSDDKDEKGRLALGGTIQTALVAGGTYLGGPIGAAVGFGVGEAIKNGINNPDWAYQRSTTGVEDYQIVSGSHESLLGLGKVGFNNITNPHRTDAVDDDTNGMDIASRWNNTNLAEGFKNDFTWLFNNTIGSWSKNAAASAANQYAGYGEQIQAPSFNTSSLFDTDAAASGMDEIGGGMDGLAERFNADWATMEQQAQEKISGIQAFFAPAVSDLQAQGDLLQQSVSNNWTEIENAVSETTSMWGGYVDSAVSQIESALSGLEQRAAGIWDSIKNAAANAWTQVGQMASNALASAGSWVSGAASKVSNSWLGNLWSERNAPGPHATGSDYFEGGLAQINEHGGEIVDLPTGSRIYPAATTERIIQKEVSSSAPSRQAPNVTISGNTFVVRNDGDIQEIAYKLAQLIIQGQQNYGGGYA